MPIAAVAVMQTIFFLAHWLLYHTVKGFWTLSASASHGLAAILFVLSLSFSLGSLLSHRYDHPLVAGLYRFAAIWLGPLNFLFFAACLWAVLDPVAHAALPAAWTSARPWVGAALFGIAAAAIVYGFINARVIRTRRMIITLPNLPEAWRGRKALLITDLHLGTVNGTGFARRLARLAKQLDPSIIFIPGDLFDGTRADAFRLAAPLFEWTPPLGVYFSEGNHEEFGDPEGYCAALRHGGMRVLRNESVDIDGLRVIGVPYAESIYPLRFKSFLEGLALDSNSPSILLNHVPNRLPIVEHAGVSLQLSGHTHGGQVFPFTWFTRRAFGKFTYGLQNFGKLQVLTSSGAGSWGPPMRVGTAPEVILITFA